jgi:hypothetical protein
MRPDPPPAGLCNLCRHQRLVRNTRGSSFSLCRRSKTDPSFPRYPRLPVVECRGYEPAEPEPEAEAGPEAPAAGA